MLNQSTKSVSEKFTLIVYLHTTNVAELEKKMMLFNGK